MSHHFFRQSSLGLLLSPLVCAADIPADNLTVNATMRVVGNPPTMADRFVVTASGNVGIGVSNPVEKLDVAGQVRVTGGAATTPAFLAGSRGMSATSYSYVLHGDNDAGPKLVAFVNGSARPADGGVNAATIRNDGGDFNVGGPAGKLRLLGNSTIIGADPGGSELLRVGGDIRSSGRILQTQPFFAWRNVDHEFIGITGSSVYDGTVARIEIIGKSHPREPNAVFNWTKKFQILDPAGGNSFSTVIGADPGGSEMLRVSGSSRFNGDIIQGNATGINLAADGAYFGIGAYWGGGWRNYTANQGGAVIRNSGGTFEIFTGSNPGAAGSLITTMAPRMVISSNGNIGIGVPNPTSKLAVAGTITASEVKVTANPADYVFADDYRLRPLSEVASLVKAHRHLPGVPSAQDQIQAGSVSLSEMQRIHLEKIEELTLYAIEADKKISTQAREMSSLVESHHAMEQRLAALEAQMKQFMKPLP